MSNDIVNPGRRNFFKGLGAAGMGAAALVAAGGFNPARADFDSSAIPDDPNAIFTAALIAEDPATTFYYNSLAGGVITDPALAGPGGTAANAGAGGNVGNVNYIQAALTQEIAHAGLLRSLLNGSAASGDPYQTFYFPAGAFDTQAAFTGMLIALESAFIGAYLAACLTFWEHRLAHARGSVTLVKSTRLLPARSRSRLGHPREIDATATEPRP